MLFTALIMISNSWASTKYVRMQQFEGGDTFIAAVINSLPSGMYNTAHEGSYLHQQFRIERCTSMSKLLYEVRKDVVKNPGKYPDPEHVIDILDFTLLGQCEYHHSDDFQSYLLIFCIPILALYDNTRHYADFASLKLKFDLACARPGNNFGGCPTNINSLIPKKLVDKFHINAGSRDGTEYNNGKTFEPVTIYDYDTRLNFQFKTPYTIIQHTEEFPCGVITNPGAEFLRQFLKLPDEDEQFGDTWVIPLRGVPRFMAKLKFFPQKALNPFEVLMKLICAGYGCAGNRPLHRCVNLIYEEFKQHHQLTPDDIMAGIQSLPDKKSYKHKIGNLSLVEKSSFPTYDTVCQFVSANRDTRGAYKNLIRRDQRNDYKRFAPLSREPIVSKYSKVSDSAIRLKMAANAQLSNLLRIAKQNNGSINHNIVATYVSAD